MSMNVNFKIEIKASLVGDVFSFNNYERKTNKKIVIHSSPSLV